MTAQLITNCVLIRNINNSDGASPRAVARPVLAPPFRPRPVPETRLPAPWPFLQPATFCRTLAIRFSIGSVFFVSFGKPR